MYKEFLPEINNWSAFFNYYDGGVYKQRACNNKSDALHFSGTCICKYENGDKFAKGKFKNGNFDGKVQVWNPNSGSLKEESEWKNGVLHGTVIQYDDEKIIRISQWKEGKPIGVFHSYYLYTNKLLSEYRFSDEGILLKYTLYKRNGNFLRTIDYQTGAYTDYNKDGSLSVTGFVNQKNEMDSIWTIYDSVGIKTAEYRYKNDKRNGKADFYLRNGAKYSSVYFVNNVSVKEIPVLSYPNNQPLRQRDTSNNYAEFNPDGTMIRYGHYNKNGLKDSVWIIYSSSHGKLYEQRFANDTLNGWTHSYYESGKKRASFNYKKGVLVSRIIYYESGQIHEIRELPSGKIISYYENGKIYCEGQLKYEKKSGWFVFYDSNGKEKERKKFNSWDED